MYCISRPDSLRRYSLLSLGTLLLFLGLARQAAGQNLLTNGNFDQTTGVGFTLNNGYASVGNGTEIPGWTTTVGSANGAGVYISQQNSGANWIPDPQNGRFSVQLDSTSNDALGTSSTISQSVMVTAGQSYLLSFWFNTEVKANLASIIQLNLSGAKTYTAQYTTTAGPNVTKANAVWVHITAAFTAASTGALKIQFADISTSDSNASVDNVSLTVVPEPATCLAGALALGYVGIRVRKRRLARRT
jgi:Protein of unknown function (DUF642)